jgi:class 3 adenylate cyclase
MTGADGGAGPGTRPTWRWDVALSFAGAQRDYVEQVAEALQARGVRCFYDADEQIELWGKYLAEELPAIYGEQAAAVVVFVSAEYAARDWTRHERRAALVRAVRERREYVLPARFDDTPLPGLLADMVAVDLRTRTPQQFAAMISGKLAVLGIAAPSANAGDLAQDLETAPPAGAVRVGEVGLLRRGHRVGAVRAGTLRHVTAVENEPDPIRPLDELVEAARKEAQAVARQADALQVIAFFDLSGSTRSKLERGNASASQAALTFTSLASSISARFGGRVLKTLGDGALATFNDPLAACRAALNLRYATHELLDLEMTAGLTSGRPLRIALDGDRDDVLGDVVDRAARIQSLALPGQVLIDATLYSQVRADIAAQPGWQVDSSPRRAHAKGIGPIELFELCLGAHWRLKKELATPFDLIISGRPTISEKLALISNAKSEIIEIGIGLTSFAQYFTGQKPEEFRDPIRQLVRGGVNLKWVAPLIRRGS